MLIQNEESESDYSPKTTFKIEQVQEFCSR